MIFLTQNVKIPEIHHFEFLQTLNSIGKLVRTQTGCISYHINQNLEQNNLILLQSEWEDKESMKRYLESSKFAIVMGAMRTFSLFPEIKVGKLTSVDQKQLLDCLQ